MNAWAKIYRTAAEQHGAIARWQAPSLGVPLTSFDRRVRREQWERPHPGICLVPGADATRHETQVSCALLAIGGHGMATGWSGLHLHGVLDRPPPIVTLVVPWTGSRRRLRAVRIIRSRTLLPEDRTVVAGLAVAAVERCFLDSGRVDSVARLRTLQIDARQRRIGVPASTGARALLHPKVPGSSKVVTAARQVESVGADSALTDAVHRRLIAAGLIPDATSATVTVPTGRILHPDITYARERVSIECDSLGFHGTQRGLDLDHRKDQGYRQALWNCLRIGWYRYENDWDGFERDVRAALGAA